MTGFASPAPFETREQRTLFGHPIGLYVLFFTEAFERFCYYGMRAVLILYLTNYFLMPQANASRIYKWYTALVYLTPLMGGYLADRFLGNKLAVIIGAITMAAGEFMLAWQDMTIFYVGLFLLIIGNGFFKPNMSVQVGRLYRTGDPRRDGAYTIFYMGINLGAFLAPLVCGSLAEMVGFRWGFLAAGIGMLLGLIIYLVGQPWVLEIAEDKKASKDSTQQSGPGAGPSSNDPDDRQAIPWLNQIGPGFFAFLATAAIVAGPVLYKMQLVSSDNAIFSFLIGLAIATIAFVLFRTTNRDRDRSLAIVLLMIFVITFWFAFEQAGNVLNVWADKHTDRFALDFGPKVPPPVELPAATQPAPARAGMSGFEVPASWFQSVNPVLIVLLAPLFAWFWVWLSRSGREPSTPAKMAIGVFLCGLSFVVMVGAAKSESAPSSTALGEAPDSIALSESDVLGKSDEHGEFHPYAAGRLKYDQGSRQLRMQGVLPDTERDRILGDSANPGYKQKVKELVEKANEAAKTSKNIDVRVKLDELPPGFDFRWTTLKDEARFEADTRSLIAMQKLSDREERLLYLAAADPKLRPALWNIYRESAASRVSTLWLLLSYLLATMGELCLSPVGLSMVSKLAPTRFATLLMGLWLCNSFFANFLAGFMGELWGKIDPVTFFSVFVVVCVALAAVLWVLTTSIRKMMHGVH